MDRQHRPGAGTLIAETLVEGAVGTPGKRTLVDVEGGRGFGVGSPVHATPAASRVAERERASLNAVLKVVAYDAHGSVIRSWGAKAKWEGRLPQHFHGDHSGAGWHWDDMASARSVRVNTRADGTGGESVEAWAGRLHAARVEIFAEPIDAVAERDQPRSDDPSAPGHANDARNADDDPAERSHPGGHSPGVVNHRTPRSYGREDHTPNRVTSNATLDDPSGASAAFAASGDVAGLDERLSGAIAFEHDLGIDLAQDEDAGDAEAAAEPHGTDTRGAGYEGGTPDGRTGKEASTTGQGPGGEAAKEGGDDEGSTSTRDNQGTKTGDRDGEHNGSEHGRYAGEGRDSDVGVRGAGAIFGGVIAVPASLQGAVEIALLIDAGDITGAAGELFAKGIGKGFSIAATRKLVAREARIAAAKKLRVIAKDLSHKKAFTELAKAERDQVLRITYWETQRQYFRAYLKAAKQEQRAVRAELRKAKPSQLATLEARSAAANAGEEIAKVEPVAGRLPQNHAYAGHEFPRSELPPKYRKDGLKFKDTGYPDFEPYAKTLPNGQKKVHIQYQGSWKADAEAANRAAHLDATPEGWTWHHDEADLGAMYLVPKDLHRKVNHTGGVAEYKHRHGAKNYDD